MKNYSLQANEVVLFENDVNISRSKAANHLILTNHYIVIVSTTKKLFKKEEINVEKYPVSDVKIYDDTPQVKQNKSDVTVFLVSGELEFSFDSTTKAIFFANKMIELITGKNVSKRGADKVKDAIGLVDHALGINTMGTISGVIENGIGGTLLKGIGRKQKTESNKSSTAEVLTSAANATTSVIEAVSTAKNSGDPPKNTEQKPEMTYEQRIDAVKKLKELLDMGIISQEQFDAKKNEILQL